MATAAIQHDSLTGKKTIPLKDLSGEPSKTFDPQEVEAKWYDWWDSQGFFIPTNKRAPNFTLLIPPPNVTGSLHIGHGLTVSIEDTITRWHRMCGHNTLYIPGSDHAGIATQSVVERKLAQEGTTRLAIGREAFLARTHDWRNESGNRIYFQFRRLAASVDWTRTFFTLDEERAAAVKEAFLRLADKGIIYRAERLVNWSVLLRSAISDEEVDQEEVGKLAFIKVPGYEKGIQTGFMLHFCYPVLKEGSDDEIDTTCGEIVVATTRPETIPGDVAVAVHPDDERYKHLIGRRLKLPFRAGSIPVIGDGVLVNMEAGTGCVKVTPAHDASDFECGQRNKLPIWSMFTEDGRIIDDADIIADSDLRGMPRLAAREVVYQKLLARGLVRDPTRKIETAEDGTVKIPKDYGKVPHTMKVSRCSRSGGIIEPMIKPQWWLDLSKSAARALKAVEDGDLVLLPGDMHHSVWRHYLANLRPWCLSRQLWWGHRIPAYKVAVADAGSAGADAAARTALVAALEAAVAQSGLSFADIPSTDGRPPATAAAAAARLLRDGEWCVAPDDAAAIAKIVANAAAVGVDLLAAAGVADVSALVASKVFTLVQDEDVLDTWFSSAMLPFSACGWPNESHPDFTRFFPGSVLETGSDILFFWVARMVMMSLELCDKLPFYTVPLHAMVRDKEGQKMSKSKGNVIDPLAFLDGVSLATLQQQLTDAMKGIVSEKELERGLDIQRKWFPIRENAPEGGITICGSDALRFALLSYSVTGTNINLDPLRVEGYRAFGNKLWNVLRFAMFHSLPAGYVPPRLAPPTIADLADLAATAAAGEAAAAAGNGALRGAAIIMRWTLSRLAAAVEASEQHHASYSFGALTQTIYSFIWDEFADWTIELCKPIVRASADSSPALMAAQPLMYHTLWCVLDALLRLLHPLMPFLTEELWHRLPGRAAVYEATESIMVAPYPRPLSALYDEGCRQPHKGTATIADVLAGKAADVFDVPFYVPVPTRDAVAEAKFAAFEGVVKTIRSLRADYNITKPDTPVHVAVLVDDVELLHDLTALAPFAAAIIGVHRVTVGYDKDGAAAAARIGGVEHVPKPAGSATLPCVDGSVLVHLSLAGAVDAKFEISKIEKKLAAAEKSKINYEKQVQNMKAPEAVRAQNAELLAAKHREIDLLNESLADFKSLL